MPHRLPPLVIALLLAGCEQAAEEAAEESKQPAPAARWTMQASATAGAAILFRDASGNERLRIACRHDPAELYAEVPAFRTIGSEERLTLGAGDELAVLVATAEPEGVPVAATGQPAPAFIAALAAGGAVNATYGAQEIGPLPPLPAGMRRSFAKACVP